MSRRREAAELARVLALSTQQTRDIAGISPNSLSSGHAAATQDSRDMELKILGARDHMSTELTEDEVALFSSHSAADEAQQSHIQSFNPSETLPSHHQSSPHTAAPSNSTPLHPRMVEYNKALGTHLASASSGHISPTQVSAHAESDIVVPRDRGQESGTIYPGQERTPLRSLMDNGNLQLSSSPVESSPQKIWPPKARMAPQVKSDTEDIEFIEATPHRTATPASRIRRPEIILQSRSASRGRSRCESPDPLDIIRTPSTSLAAQRPDHPRSSATEPVSTGTERKSGRVKAAAEKKELEKEEKRRIRRERKAKEEEERKAKSAGASSSKSKRQKRTDSRSTPAHSTQLVASHRESEITEEMISSSVSKRKSISRRVTLPDAIGNSRPPISYEAERVAILTPPKPQTVTTEDEAVLPENPKGTSPPKSSPMPNSPGAVELASGIRTPASVQPPPLECRPLERIASTSLSRGSPGPSGPDGRPQRPQGIKWQTSRDDLSSVLAKFGGARPTGMSKRHRIAPLHAKIGPPAKALPPVPQKPVRKKKGEESDEEESGEGESEDEHGVGKGKSKVKGLEWYMVED